MDGSTKTKLQALLDTHTQLPKLKKPRLNLIKFNILTLFKEMTKSDFVWDIVA